MRRILFLDIDGVLNSTRWSGAHPVRGLVPPSTAKEALDEKRLDPSCVTRLQFIVSLTMASIVVSSSWRHRLPIAEFIRLFRYLEFPDAPIIGVTPSRPGPRGGEVREWLEGYGKPIETYACLDDDSDYSPDQRLVRVDPEFGLQDRDLHACVTALLSPFDGLNGL